MIERALSDKLMMLFNVNPKIVTPETWNYALNVELEHKDVTKKNLILTSKIALAHLEEYCDYYKRLKKMELQAEKFWKNKNKPNIYNNLKK